MKKFNGFAVGEVWQDAAGNDCSYRENGTLRVTTVNKEPSMTIQSEKDACDINKIVAKFKRTGIMSNVRNDQPKFGDFTAVCDFQTAVMRIQEAEESFMTLPALTRKRFSNDPGELIDFLGKPENREEAIKLGLIAKDSLPQDSHAPLGKDKADSVESAKKSTDQ